MLFFYVINGQECQPFTIKIFKLLKKDDDLINCTFVFNYTSDQDISWQNLKCQCLEWHQITQGCKNPRFKANNHNLSKQYSQNLNFSDRPSLNFYQRAFCFGESLCFFVWQILLNYLVLEKIWISHLEENNLHIVN